LVDLFELPGSIPVGDLAMDGLNTLKRKM